MSSSRNWQGPTAEELAAYVDGELSARPAEAELARRVEAWLGDHPEARAEVEWLRDLGRLWADTTPLPPGESAWRRVRAHLPQAPARGRWVRRAGLWALVAAATTGAAAAGLLFFASPVPPPPQRPPATVQNRSNLLDEGEPLEVASADEIEILQVEGADSQSLVVSDLPMGHPLELLNPGEVSLVHPMLDAMINARLDATNRPMFWARTDTERPGE